MIVDGGLGMELEQRGFRVTTRLWSGEAVLRAPDLLTAVHRDFLAAGARVIETATYQLAHVTLRELGHDDDAIDAIFASAVRIARDAVAAHRTATSAVGGYVVAASLGPYGAIVGDGSEYSDVQHLDRATLYAFHAERARAVARARPDVIFFETIPSQLEAVVIAEVARDLGLPAVWISFSCPDGARTYGGDAIGTAAAALEAYPNIDVIGVNCIAPASVIPLVQALKAVTSRALLVCPNLGQYWDSTQGLAGGETEAEFLRYVPRWRELGIAHIGGCCGVSPTTIGALAAIVEAA